MSVLIYFRLNKCSLETIRYFFQPIKSLTQTIEQWCILKLRLFLQIWFHKYNLVFGESHNITAWTNLALS